jgi:hypothetical protein
LAWSAILAIIGVQSYQSWSPYQDNKPFRCIFTVSSVPKQFLIGGALGPGVNCQRPSPSILFNAASFYSCTNNALHLNSRPSVHSFTALTTPQPPHPPGLIFWTLALWC